MGGSVWKFEKEFLGSPGEWRKRQLEKVLKKKPGVRRGLKNKGRHGKNETVHLDLTLKVAKGKAKKR